MRKLTEANRLLASMGYTELCWTLLTQRTNTGRYRLLPFSKSHFHAVSTDIVECDADDVTHPAWNVNRCIHDAIGPLQANVVLHSHDDISSIFSSAKRIIRPLLQESVYFYKDRFMIHDAQDTTLGTKLQLNPNAIAISLLNHGTACWGRSIDEAVVRFHYLQRSMKAELHAEISGKAHMPDENFVLELQKRWENDNVFSGMHHEYNSLIDKYLRH